MLVAFSVAPSGGAEGGDSVHDAVAAAVRIVRESGLPNRTDSMFTTIEGDWDEVFDVVSRATRCGGPLRLAGVAGAEGGHPAGLHRRDHRQTGSSGAGTRRNRRSGQKPPGMSCCNRMPSWIARLRSATLVPTSMPATRYFSRIRLR